MLINYSELQVFVCWSCLRSAHYANAPKFTSCFLCCHICFKVWACLIVHYCSLLHANLYTNIPFGNYFPNKMQSCLATIDSYQKAVQIEYHCTGFFQPESAQQFLLKKKIQMGSDFPPRAPTVGLILVWNDQYAPNREWSRLVCLE